MEDRVREKETKQGTYTFTKHDAAWKPMRAQTPQVTPPSGYDDGGPKIGLKRWKKVGYKFNPLMDEVEQPHVMLVNRRLNNICEIVNISNFRMTLKELNQANEISFTVNKTLNDFEQPFYERIADLGVVYVNGEFFEIGITNQEDASIKKNVVGVSLGYAELSQIITSVQINTDEDWDRDDLNEVTKNGERYKNGTIFYNPVQVGDTDECRKWRQLTSMLDRVLSDAPHYKIGTVDETLRNVQRTFSWEDTDILSILNDIGQEVGCVFDIVVEYDTDGNAVRKVNAYDLCYCKYCWTQVRGQNEEFGTSGDVYRNVENGVCLNCKDTTDVNDGHKRTGGEDIIDIGTNTGIFLSTDNLTDDITVDGNKDGIKTAFKVVGGDDLMTDTLQGLNPSGSNKITLIPAYIMKNFSPDLYTNYKLYREANAAAEKPYGELLEMIYHLQDIWLYLKSGKMPVFDEPIVDADVAFNDVIIDIGNNFYNLFYIDKRDNYSSDNTYPVKNSVSKMMKTFMPKGFNVTVEVDRSDSNYKFNGSITVYSTSNKDDTITVSKNGSVVNITSGEDKRPYTKDENIASAIESFVRNITFKFGDNNNTDYAEYIKRYCASLLSKNDLEYENDKEKDWSLYSYERLKNWRDGYQACIDTLSGMYQSAETSYAKKIVANMIGKYSNIRDEIQLQMNIVENQLYAIGTFLGEYDSLFLDSEGRLLEHSYKIPEVPDELKNPEMYLKYDYDNGGIQVRKTQAEITDMRNNFNKARIFFTSKFSSDSSAIRSLTDTSESSISLGSGDTQANYTMKCDIGTYPFKCKKCGSSNVKRLKDGGVYCVGCHTTDYEDFTTYRSITAEVIDFYNRFDSFISDLSATLGAIVEDAPSMKTRLLNNGKTLYGLRQSIQDILDIRSVDEEKDGKLIKPFFLNDAQFGELMSYMREDVYTNSNYISEGLTDDELLQQAKELQKKAKRELSKACMPQYSITASVGSIIALEPYEFLGVSYNEDLANFAINNYVHVRFDDDIYKLRVASIELSYPMSDKISVSFTNAERYENGFSSDVASILANAQSMATSFDAVATQSEKGVMANDLFNKIKKQGLDTSLMAVNGGRNQDVVIDDHGILLRELNEYTNKYDPHQTKIVSNNFVMTDDEWKSARLAIGLTLNPEWTEAKETGLTNKMRELEKANLKYLYGVYADAIVSDLVMSKHFRRIGNGYGDECTVDIDANGINIAKGFLDIHDEKGNRAIINPCGIDPGPTRIGTAIGDNVSANYIFYAATSQPLENFSSSELAEIRNTNGSYKVFHIDRSGNAFFAGKIEAKSGFIGGWKITNESLNNEQNANASIYTGGNSTWRQATGYGGGSGFHLSQNGLSIGNGFSVDSQGNLIAYNGRFSGELMAASGTFTGEVTSAGLVTGRINVNNGVFTVDSNGEMTATKGYIGGWEISNNALISYSSNKPKICTHDRINGMDSNTTGSDGGFYLSEDGLSVGNFYIETTGGSKGMMTMPKCRIAPFKHEKYGQVAGHIQFIGSQKAAISQITCKPKLDFSADGNNKGDADVMYLIYGLVGEDSPGDNTFKSNLYSCLEIRNRWIDNDRDTFNDTNIDYLGRLRVDNLIIGKHSLKHILGKMYHKLYGDDHDINYNSWHGYT